MAITINKPTVDGSEDTWGTILNGTLDNIGNALNSAAVEIAPDLTVGSWKIGGTAVTSTAAELNILDGVTATTAELNLLDGVTATTAELNYVDGVTSNIQTQLDALDTGKQDADAALTAYAGTLTAANKLPYATAADTAGELDLQTTITDSDTSVPTSGAVVDHVAGLAVGIGQTYQDVSGSRVAGTSYQNSTGRPIQVIVSASNTSMTFQVSSDGATWITIGTTGTNDPWGFSPIIPDTWYYRATSGSGISAWVELR